MTTALRTILKELFAEPQMSFVCADCFQNNERCKRLLRKLQFSPVEIPALERIQIALEYQCSHWIERYAIDRDTWNRMQTDL